MVQQAGGSRQGRALRLSYWSDHLARNAPRSCSGLKRTGRAADRCDDGAEVVLARHKAAGDRASHCSRRSRGKSAAEQRGVGYATPECIATNAPNAE